jgi:hypothetical protein
MIHYSITYYAFPTTISFRQRSIPRHQLKKFHLATAGSPRHKRRGGRLATINNSRRYYKIIIIRSTDGDGGSISIM